VDGRKKICPSYFNGVIQMEDGRSDTKGGDTIHTPTWTRVLLIRYFNKVNY